MSDIENIDLKKIKLDNDVNEAISITKNPNSRFRYMGTYSPIIGTTNENQNEIAQIINYSDKKVLVTGSSADQYLSSVFFGSKDETIYDIDVLAEYYIYLKVCAFRNLNYNNYMEFMLPFINKTKYFSPDTVKQLSSELPPYIKNFWTLYLEEIDISKIGNFIQFLDSNILSIKNKIPYFDEKNYNILKDILKKKDYPKFIEANASYFEYYIKDTYDFISLSNIIECNQQPFDDAIDKRLYSNKEWIEYIKTVICKNINPSGELLVFQTSDWNSEEYVKEGFVKHLISSNENEKNVALILKR